jgi:hypothetical protein
LRFAFPQLSEAAWQFLDSSWLFETWLQSLGVVSILLDKLQG